MTDHSTLKKQPILQQRCLHHVKTFCVRNLTISLHNDDSTSNHQLYLYFTIHPGAKYQLNKDLIPNLPDEIFRSKSIDYCCNPTWSYLTIPFNIINFAEFIVRLWIGADEDFMPALQWNIPLPSLNCIGDALHSNKLIFHSNAIALGMHGKYYSSNSSVTLRPPLNSLQAYDFGEAKNSYSVFALNRLLSTQKSLKTNKDKVTTTRVLSKKNEENQRSSKEIKMELEQISNRIKHLKILVQREQALLRREKEKAFTFKMQLDNQETQANEEQSRKLVETAKFHQDHETCIEKKIEVSQLVKQLGLRRRDILAELSLVFPISCIQEGKSMSALKKPLIDRDKIHTICGVKLPESENFNHKEDLPTSVGLGYTAQLLNMMSNFLLVPLRYPIVLKGSLSCVVDHVTEKLSERERVFPLHIKGNKDRFISDYGVFLLNKNVAQLRYYCGLGTTDLRPTLENIKSLLEERLGAKPGAVGHQSQPIDINPNREVLQASQRNVNRSPGGDSLLQSSGYESNISTDISVRSNTLNQAENLASPRRLAKKLGYRRNHLQNMRGELFGSNEQVLRKSPNEHRKNPNISQPDRVPSPFEDLINTTVSKPSFNFDSIESFSFIPPSHRVKYTGLEEIEQTVKKETKLPYNSARAELLGKRANQQSKDSTVRKNWSASRPLTGNLMEKRSELFRKRNPQKDLWDSDSNNSPNFESENSVDPSPSGSNAEVIEIDKSMITENNENADIANLAAKVFAEPEVYIIDPSKSHLQLMDESEEEIDLC